MSKTLPFFYLTQDSYQKLYLVIDMSVCSLRFVLTGLQTAARVRNHARPVSSSLENEMFMRKDRCTSFLLFFFVPQTRYLFWNTRTKQQLKLADKVSPRKEILFQSVRDPQYNILKKNDQKGQKGTTWLAKSLWM